MFATQLVKESSPLYPHNDGQQAEREARYTITGTWQTADNNKGGADVLNLQIKSFRATLCNGSDVNGIMEEYGSVDGFLFVDREEATIYHMNINEFMQFAERFAVIDKSSKGTAKVRLNRQYKAQRQYLRHNA